MVLFHFIHVSSSNGLKKTFELKNNNKIHKALSLDAYYEALPSKRLPSLFQLWYCGQKWLCSGVTIFTLANYRENIKHIFLSESTRPRALICLCLFICVHLSIISTEVYFTSLNITYTRSKPKFY